MRKNLFEGISDNEIKKTMANIYNNLDNIANSQKNSHTFKKHSDKTDDYLKSRIENKKIHSSTSFYCADDAKVASLMVIKHYWAEIENFLLGNMERIDFQLDLGNEHKIGFGYLDNVEGVFEDCHKVCIVLDKDEHSDWGFYILTAYPIITRDLTAEFIN